MESYNLQLENAFRTTDQLHLSGQSPLEHADKNEKQTFVMVV